MAEVVFRAGRYPCGCVSVACAGKPGASFYEAVAERGLTVTEHTNPITDWQCPGGNGCNRLYGPRRLIGEGAGNG